MTGHNPASMRFDQIALLIRGDTSDSFLVQSLGQIALDAIDSALLLHDFPTAQDFISRLERESGLLPESPELRHAAASALARLIDAQQQIGQFDQACASFERLLRLCNRAQTDVFCAGLAIITANNLLGGCMAETAQDVRVIEAADIHQNIRPIIFNHENHPRIRHLYGDMLINLIAVYGASHHPDAAASLADELLERIASLTGLQESVPAAVIERIMAGLYNAALALAQSGRSEQGARLLARVLPLCHAPDTTDMLGIIGKTISDFAALAAQAGRIHSVSLLRDAWQELAEKTPQHSHKDGFLITRLLLESAHIRATQRNGQTERAMIDLTMFHDHLVKIAPQHPIALEILVHTTTDILGLCRDIERDADCETLTQHALSLLHIPMPPAQKTALCGHIAAMIVQRVSQLADFNRDSKAHIWQLVLKTPAFKELADRDVIVARCVMHRVRAFCDQAKPRKAVTLLLGGFWVDAQWVKTPEAAVALLQAEAALLILAAFSQFPTIAPLLSAERISTRTSLALVPDMISLLRLSFSLYRLVKTGHDASVTMIFGQSLTILMPVLAHFGGLRGIELGLNHFLAEARRQTTATQEITRDNLHEAAARLHFNLLLHAVRSHDTRLANRAATQIAELLKHLPPSDFRKDLISRIRSMAELEVDDHI